jgi:hypothetical protein
MRAPDGAPLAFSSIAIVPATVASAVELRTQRARTGAWAIITAHRLAALIIARVGIVWSLILAIGVRIELRAIAGVVDDLLRRSRSCSDDRKNGRGSQESGFRHEEFSSK